MRKWQNKKGFTMAELLIVVAIIGILAGVSFVAVQNHQHSMTRMERDSIAKEIFMAAQNHLTLADSQGYLGAQIDYGNKENESQHIYYIVNSGTAPIEGSALELMLPFGSIDEKVRSNDSYVIRYQSNPATVLDVFYWGDSSYLQPGGTGYTIDSVTKYEELKGLGGDDKTGARERHNPIIGWYGGEDIQEAGEYTIEAPIITVYNQESLYVEVTNPNTGKPITPSLKLIVTGVDSGAKAAFVLDTVNKDERVVAGTGAEKYTVTLDDVTKPDASGQGYHFAALSPTYVNDSYVALLGTFRPGEDIIVEAVAYAESKLANIAYSNQITTNSLFADVQPMEGESTTGESIPARTAIISNFRHLVNLDASVSGLSSDVRVQTASQIADLDWHNKTDLLKSFVGKIGDGVQIYNYGGDDGTKSVGTKPNCYLPVNLSGISAYSGNGHSVSNLVVDNTLKLDESPTAYTEISAGGLFGTASGCAISDLKLIDAKVTLSSGKAGALAGSLTNCTVTNVVACNSTDYEKTMITPVGGTAPNPTRTTVSTSGDAGGLIGSTNGCTVSKCAAALIVTSSGGNAGGLIGATEGGTVSNSYSGGHAAELKDSAGDIIGVGYNSANVTASAAAGGLIGEAKNTGVDHSYSTCSVTGATAGGFVGSYSAAGSTQVSSCYATGLVTGKSGTSKTGAFAGELAAGKANSCHYYEIINETVDSATKAVSYLPPVSGGEAYAGIDALDETAASYNTFVGGPDSWGDAEPYLGKTTADETDDWLDIYYGEGKYPLKTAAQLGLGSTIKNTDFVATHYGDWPVPEVFVINTK